MNIPDHECLASLIDRRLGEMGINQIELAARSTIPDSTWSRWRSGALPNRLYVELAAKALDVSSERLQAVIDEDRRRRAGVVIDTPTEAQAWIDTKAPANAEQGA